MKKIFILLIFSFFVISCEELVEEKVYSTLTSNGFFQSEADIVTGVNGIYDAMQADTWNISLLWMNDMMPGALCHNWSYQGWNTLNLYDSWDTWFNHSQLWSRAYVIIGRVNVLLDALENSPVKEEVRNKYEAEARFIRAYAYFVLANTFGHVPLATKAPDKLADVLIPDSSSKDTFDSDFLKQVDRDVIHEFIIKELQFCEENLPSEYNSSGVGRVTKWSAKGMLAKLYLTMAGKQYNYNNGQLENGDPSNYNLCLQKVEEIIHSGKFSLLQDYQNVFGGLYDNVYDNNEEILFAIQFVSTAEAGQSGEGNDLVLRYGIRGANITPYSILQARANDVFMADFINHNSVDNPRYHTTFLTEYTNSGGKVIRWGETSTFMKPHVKKLLSDYDYPNIESTGRTDYGDDVIILRYADILLMQSEVLNEINGPNENTLEGINQVRERVDLSPIELPIDQQSLRDLIFEERKWELAYEGHYYFDCQRTGRLTEEIIRNWHNEREVEKEMITNKYYLMPIPFWAIEKNPSLKQNFGY